MAFPNIPRNGPDWQRRAADAVNYLLNQVGYFHIGIEGSPTAAQELFKASFAVPINLLQSMSVGRAGTAATATATFIITIGGATAGTIAFLAGQTEATVALTTTRVPALSELKVVAPSPQDATLADITLELATEA